MNRYLLAPALFVLTSAGFAQQEGPIATETLVNVESKAPVKPKPADIKLEVNNRSIPVTSLVPVKATGAQIALLIDDGLRSSVGRALGDLRAFIQQLRPGTEVLIGYMQNGRVVSAQNFTTDYTVAANSLRIPMGAPGMSASPYFCLSDFVKKWPGEAGEDGNASTAAKARFVMMITNGVDPYNGSVSPANQDSPYVDAAIADAQRAGVAVYSIYYNDAGFRNGGLASFSGQSYLAAVSDATGGRAYFQGTSNPVSMSPFLSEFQKAIAETYIATFDAVAHDRRTLVRLKMSTDLPKTKLHVPAEVHPGTRQTGSSPGQAVQ